MRQIRSSNRGHKYNNGNGKHHNEVDRFRHEFVNDSQDDIDLHDFYNVELRTDNQRRAFSTFKRCDYLFLIGPAAVGKSFVATALAAREVISNRAQRVLLTRPVIEAGESLGFLPGGFHEKVEPYMRPLYDQLLKVFNNNKKAVTSFDERFIEKCPLAYMRGRTFDNSICIFDEAQNSTAKQLKMCLTRLGENSKMIVTGDPHQVDIQNSGLMETIDKCKHRGSVSVIQFENCDNCRHESVEWMLEDL